MAEITIDYFFFFYWNSSNSCSYALFDTDGNQVPQELVTKVGGIFETILEEVINFVY